MSDDYAGGSAPSPETERRASPGPDTPTGALSDRPSADDFQPDVPPTEVMPAAPTQGLDPTPGSDELHLIPGATLANGRYRLLVFHGGPEHLQFWQALDTALDRQVALTFVDPDGALPSQQVQGILDRTQRLGNIDMPGVARVLDALPTKTGGLVVSEWIRGGSLAEVAATAPSPVGGARAIQSLAAVAEVAHRNGVALSVDHPSRIRVSIEGDVALAFPATLADATPEDDIRGIGAALYALLVNRWPLPETGVPSGLAPADLDPAGQPVEPRSVDRDIPFQISAAAAHAVQENGGIRSAPTLLNLLQQATAIADRTDHISPVDDRDQAPAQPWPDDADPDAEARRRKGLIIGLTVGAVAVIVAVVVLATVLSRIFGDVGSGLGGDALGLNAPDSSQQQDEGQSTATGADIKPVRATVFSPGGGADAPELAGRAIDGDDSTVWPTDTYSDPVPFPNFKSGLGLMLELSKPETIGSVTIDLNSTGTVVQIRSSSTASPSSLDATTALTQPTPLKPGSNTIKVDDAEPTSNVLVWITTLGQVDGESRTDIAEIELHGTS